MLHLLWIEDDPALRRVYRPLLEAEGYVLSEAATPTQALAAVQQHPPDLVLLDLMLPPTQRPEDGLALLEQVLGRAPRTKVVVLTGVGGQDTALEAVRRGAADLLRKPVDPDVLLVVLQRAAARAALEAALVDAREQAVQSRPTAAMLGESAPFRAAVELADKVAPTDLPVLVLGENGTGKELLARRLHRVSRRYASPFVAINCGALPQGLLESTLFGHEKGAYTGADRARKGLFTEADGGTLFLDEVGEMEPPTQVRLLRALESGEILPVGAARPHNVDVRILSATNRDLDALVAAGTFRDDLYWRLKGVEVVLPPLRDRGADILLLAQHFLREAAALVGDRNPRTLRPDAERALLSHRWAGNLRELRHTMQRAAVLAGPDGAIGPADLGLQGGGRNLDGDTLAERVGALERREIVAALAVEGGNRSRAAKRLGLSRQGLLNKLARYEIIAERSPNA
jgi:two-component system, NtrC family, response regulator AtoC